jgi:hypothetical protein
MGYKVKQSKEIGYDILEKETDVVIKLQSHEEIAHNICRKLNLGAGFDGWTPDFFANFKGLTLD